MPYDLVLKGGTVVDAGSAGAATFGAFPRHIIPHCHTEIVPFLHICQTGLATLPDISAESSVNLRTRSGSPASTPGSSPASRRA
jgi:predicted amidohydrolase